jgi:nitrite reductase/ring-hydroxylating ferredoxin subunit
MGKKVFIGKKSDFPKGELKVITAERRRLVIAQTDSGYCAVRNRCAHLSLPLSGGKIEGNIITCPWHNSQYNMCSGENMDWVPGILGVPMPEWVNVMNRMGMKPKPLQTYPVIEEGDQLFVEI